MVVEHFISINKTLGCILRTRSLQKYRETQSAMESCLGLIVDILYLFESVQKYT